MRRELMVVVWLVVSVAASSLIACDEPDPIEPDGGCALDGSGAVTVDTGPAPPEIPWLAVDGTESLTIEPPAAPMPPVLTPCPTGWTQSEAEGVPTCEPWVDGFDACPAGQRTQIGIGCVNVGVACASGRFRADAPAGAIYVEAGATGGDGSVGAPFGTLAAALTGGGGTLVLGRGTYTLPSSSGDTVTLIGHCVAESQLALPSGGARLTSSWSLRDVSVTGGGDALIVDGSLRFEEVALGGGVSVQARDATVEMIGVVMRPDTIQDGAAIEVSGGNLTVERSLLRELLGAGIVAGAGANVTIRDTGFLETESSVLQLESSASATLERVAIERATVAGIVAWGTGTSLSATDLVIRDMQEETASLGTGAAIVLSHGATGELRRSVLSDTPAEGVVLEADATLTLTDAVIARARIGVLSHSASLTMDRVSLSETGSHALDIEGGRVEARDLRIHDTGLGETSSEHVAVNLDGAGVLEITRATITGYHEIGLYAVGRADLTDVSITDGVPFDEDEPARSVFCYFGTLTGTRVELADPITTQCDGELRDATVDALDGGLGIEQRLTRARVRSVTLDGGALLAEDALIETLEVDVRTLILRRVLIPDGGVQAWVSGPSTFGEGELALAGATFEDCVFGGVAVDASGLALAATMAPVSLVRVLFQDVGPRVLLDGSTAFGAVDIAASEAVVLRDVALRGSAQGFVLAATDAVLERVLAEGNEGAEGCGVSVSDGASVSQLVGEVRGWPIGVCFDDEACETRRSAMLRFAENGENVTWGSP